MERVPYFCSGCPHNSSTKVPEGSRALAGIGCHYMAQWMDRETATFTHMGGEGASWIGQAPFTETPHVFQNIGDGTYFHSGILAIRAAVSAGVNMTYKILYNDAVAMTGGQPMDGPLSVQRVTRQIQAEGVGRIAVVTDQPEKYPFDGQFADGVTIHHRDALDQVQRELREWEGVSAIVYDQMCATEKRRRRKRGLLEDPDWRVIINPDVCEGCGDCGVQSNCLSVVPLETEFGRKRAIDQSACNKDFSCIKGFCPSFVLVKGGRRRSGASSGVSEQPIAALPEPAQRPSCAEPYGILLAGVGGTGIVTLGALLGTARHGSRARGPRSSTRRASPRSMAPSPATSALPSEQRTSMRCGSPRAAPGCCWASTWWWRRAARRWPGSTAAPPTPWSTAARSRRAISPARPTSTSPPISWSGWSERRHARSTSSTRRAWRRR